MNEQVKTSSKLPGQIFFFETFINQPKELVTIMWKFNEKN